MRPSAIAAASSASPPLNPKIEPNSARADDSAAAAAARVEQVQEQHAEAEDPGEGDADGHVVGTRPLSEPGEQQRHQHGRREQPDALVDAGGGGSQRAGEGDVAERVAGEDLRAQDDEVAEQAARDRDQRAGEQRVAHERQREHQRRSSRAPRAPA